MKKFLQLKFKNLIIIAFFALFFINTVAYSGLASNLSITSDAMFRTRADIRVTGIKLESASGGALENYSPKYNVNNTTMGFTLPNSTSSITYKITVTNFGDRNQTIYSFIKQSINKDGINVTVTDYKEKDIINFRSSVEFFITITTTNPDTTSINLIEQYDFRKVYDVEYQNIYGTQVLEPQYKYEREDLKLRSNILTKTDYDFKGWTCSLGDYEIGGKYTVDQDIILYPKFEKKKDDLVLTYNVDGVDYTSGYGTNGDRIQTKIKINNEEKYYNSFSLKNVEYGTSYDITGLKLDEVEIPYSKNCVVDGNKCLSLSFNTINFTVNDVDSGKEDSSLGSVTPTQLIVSSGTTFTMSNNIVTLSDGRIATSTPSKNITGYNVSFSGYSVVPNSATVNTKTTIKANFKKEAKKYTITLNSNGAAAQGTAKIYEKYETGVYLDNDITKLMTSSTNPITKPSKASYKIEFNSNNTGVLVSNTTFTPSFNGYYTEVNNGTQMLNENGYITSNLVGNKYTSDTTLYAQWNNNYKLPDITKDGYTCKWAKDSASGVAYSPGTQLLINSDSTFYAVCSANEYTVTFDGNGGTVNTKSMRVTYGQAYGNLPIPARYVDADSNISYVFEGWYTAPNGGEKEKVTKIGKTTLYNVAGDQTLYAHWISSPIITGGSSDWTKTSRTISLLTESISNTGIQKYQYYISTSNSELVGGTWTDFTTTGNTVTVDLEGIHYIYYRAVSDSKDEEKQNIVSERSNYNAVKVDITGPDLSVTGNLTDLTSSDVILTAKAFDLQSGLNCIKVNGELVPLTNGTGTYAAQTNGTYTFVAYDNLGNTSSKTIEVTNIDKTGPTFEIEAYQTDSDNNPTTLIEKFSDSSKIIDDWRNYSIYFKVVSATDSAGIKSVTMNLNDKDHFETSDTSLNDVLTATYDITSTNGKAVTESGNRYVRIIVTDNLGNETVKDVRVYIDKVAPEFTIRAYRADADGNKTDTIIQSTSAENTRINSWRNYQVYFEIVSETDSGSGISSMTMQINSGGSYSTTGSDEIDKLTASYNITSSKGKLVQSSGNRYIRFTVIDKLGNTTTKNVRVFIDRVVPTFAVRAYQAESDGSKTSTVLDTLTKSGHVSGWKNHPIYFELVSLSTGSGISSITMKINDKGHYETENPGANDVATATYDITSEKGKAVIASGNRVARFTVTDNAGNTTTINVRVFIDRVKPTVTVTGNPTDWKTSATLTVKASDSESGLSSVKIGNTALALTNGSATYKVTSSGTYKFVATDKAGNTTTNSVVVNKVDSTAPSVKVTAYELMYDSNGKREPGDKAIASATNKDLTIDWKNYYYYFKVEVTETQSGFASMNWERNAAGNKTMSTTIVGNTLHSYAFDIYLEREGARYSKITLKDKLGNTRVINIKAYIDKTDPSVTLKMYKADADGNKVGSALKVIDADNTPINSWTNYRHYFDLTGTTDSMSGIKSMTLQVNKGGIVDTGSSVTGASDLITAYDMTADKGKMVGSSGNRYVRIKVTDKAGNTVTKNIRIYIDLHAPTLASSSLSPRFESSTTIKYKCTDEMSGFASFGTKTLSKTYTKNVTSSNSPVTVQCTDAAGNKSSSKTYTWGENVDICGTEEYTYTDTCTKTETKQVNTPPSSCTVNYKGKCVNSLSNGDCLCQYSKTSSYSCEKTGIRNRNCWHQ